MAVVGTLMFSTNFVFFYYAEQYLTTGLVAVLFALTLPLGIFYSAVFLGRRPSATMLAGAGLGLAGMVAVFWPDLADFSLDSDSGKGILLALGGTLSFSLGSLATSRVQAAGVPVVQSTAFSMIYGALLLVPVTLASGGYSFDTGPKYVASLLYLALFGSVIGFAAYLTLLRRIGAGRAAYATVLFPIVALALSTVFEDFTWTGRALAGVGLILGGNALVSAARSPG
jgi:drug/metabolite transporter (DMT)-like permease